MYDPATGRTLQPPPSPGQAIEQGYETFVAPSARELVEQAASGTPVAPLSSKAVARYEATPSLRGLPGYTDPAAPAPGWIARKIGEATVPSTLPGLVGTAVQLGTAEETLPIKLASIAGSRALAGAATGEGRLGAAEEAVKGVGQTLLGEAPFVVRKVGKAIGPRIVGAGRQAAEDEFIQESTDAFTQHVKKHLPFLSTQKMENGSDLIPLFVTRRNVPSRAVALGIQNLNRVKADVARKVAGHHFDIEIPGEMADLTGLTKGTHALSFEQFDNTLHKMTEPGWLPSGDPRGAQLTELYRAQARKMRDKLAEALEQVSPGAGKAYQRARSMLDATHVMTDVFSQGNFWPKLVQQRKLLPNNLSERLRTYGTSLARHFGDDGVDQMIKDIQHGEPGVMQYTPYQKGKWHWGAHFAPYPPFIFPYAHHEGGQKFRSIGGELSWVDRMSHAAQGWTKALIGAGVDNIWEQHGDKVKVTPSNGPATDHLRAEQNRRNAPTPGGAETAGEIAQSLRRNRKPYDVTRDLDSQRLSTDELKKVLAQANTTDPVAPARTLPLPEVMAAAEVGDEGEKRMLVPIIQERLRQELPQMQNKTMQAKLAQRFMDLQSALA